MLKKIDNNYYPQRNHQKIKHKEEKYTARFFNNLYFLFKRIIFH